MPVQHASTARPARRIARLRHLLTALAFAAAACGSSDDSRQGANGGGGPAARGGQGNRGGPGTRGGGPDRVIPVEVGVVSRGSLARTTMVAGALEPIRTVGVNAQLAGALRTVRVEEGDRVARGQLLAEVDASEIEAQVRSAAAAYELAKSNAERAETLWNDRVITAVEYERDQAALVAAKATLDQARTRLGYASVRAPVAGVVTEKRVEAGDVVQSQARLFTIADVSTLVALVDVSELDVSGIRVGHAVDVTVDALGGARFPAVVRRVFPAADTATRMVPVEVALTGSGVGRLKPGYLARVTFTLGERPDVLLVASSAVVGTGDARAVFVLDSNVATRRDVRLGAASGDVVEVLQGLKVGDRVVTAGASELRDGAIVRVVSPVGEANGDVAAQVNGGGGR